MHSMPYRIPIATLLTVATALLSIACDTPEAVLEGDGPADPAAEQPLVPADAEELEAYLKRAIDHHLPAYRPLPESDRITIPGAPPTPFDAATAYSTTNLQTANVDEADLVKFDGETLFVAEQPVYPYYSMALEGPATVIDMTQPIDLRPEIEPASVSVYSTSEDPAEASLLTTLPLSETASIEGMMLLPGGDDGPPLLVVIGTDWYVPAFMPEPLPRPASLTIFHHGESRVQLWIFDVSDPAEPRAVHRSKVEGSLLAVRRVEEQLVLVTRYTPYVTRIPVTPGPAELDRPSALAELDVAELLPRRTIEHPGEERRRPLVAPEHCFVPRERADADERSFYHPTLVTVSMIDLRAPEEPVSVCAAGPADRIYSSTDALYLASTMWSVESQTVIHKFAYTERGPEFRGSGMASGRPGGSYADFGLGEVDDVFGIMTTVNGAASGERFDPTARLTLLAEAEDGSLELEELSHLPNAREPARIGKPGEQLHAVRFVGHRVYAVTFRRVDPLYVIDLEDPRNPFIAGELEVPGFSDLLQPVGRDLLLGVGKHVVADGGMDWLQGVKVELFDVSDPSSPQSVDSLIVGRRGSETSARFDHHALSALDLGDGTTRVAIPIEVAERLREGGDPTNPRTWYDWSHTGLHLFEIDQDAPSLQAVGALVVADARDEAAVRSTWRDRSRLQGDAVHYVHDAAVWSAPWDTPEDPAGPR